ncbi:uncharacterized protein LOC110463684 [Mizuhopecten yessoensis]|uniref:tRNA 2'-phosphotransferase 1 n=1 Tax=Mizuhopecten yessoensis TaxID=6573 RepID=A0A210PVF4_MIZYE|nr:uncharacterized protein LOC110463684 [Mizuhopecten yessoensis]OWF40471.1 tRNA 2'-phosphotransferase 1 [Mizuhopecten yessoensis]
MTLEKTSRSIVRYLHHNTAAPRDSAGYVQLLVICQLFQVSRTAVLEIVERVAKDRLNLSPCQQLIRACSGHSTDDVDVGNISQYEITDYRDVCYCVHGTTRSVYENIKISGLSRMKRQMIQFADCKDTVKRHSTVLIHLDVKRYLAKGEKLCRLQNGTLAAPGNAKGMMKTSFFHRVQFL